MNLAIIMPAYNEEKRIGRTLEEYGKFLKEKKIKFNIIVIINNTKDRTEDIVRKYKKKYKEIVYLNFKQGGKGFAIVEGFKEALKQDFDLIGFVDADMATPPEAFYTLIEKIKDYDGIIASRWIRGSIIKTEQTLLRKITSKGFNFIVKSFLMMPYSDTQCGAKLFKREAIQGVIKDIGVTRWGFDVDLLYKLRKKGFRIIEAPTIWEDKKDSKLNLKKAPFQMFSSVLRLRLVHSPFNFIVRLYDRLPEKIKIHNL